MDLVLQSEVFTLPFVSFIVGLVFCLLGRRILAFIVILFGFLIGYSWGTALLVSVLSISLHQYPWLPWAAGAAIGFFLLPTIFGR